MKPEPSENRYANERCAEKATNDKFEIVADAQNGIYKANTNQEEVKKSSEASSPLEHGE